MSLSGLISNSHVALGNSHNFLNGNSHTVPIDYDAVIIGSGFGGLRMLHECRKLGLSVKVIEAGSDVGGTWYWNRYPGARTDSESWSYIMNFSEELKSDWIWKERFPPQKEVLSYLNHVADRFDMRRSILFRTRVETAKYDEANNIWIITSTKGDKYTCQFFITATGPLSAGLKPPYEGLDTFQGEWYQTSNWPKKPIDFTGKRVAVIGTGATGVQIIPIVAHNAKFVTAFQRTPNYVIPARNYPLTEHHMLEIKRDYENIWKQARSQVFGFAMATLGRTLDDVPDEAEQQKIFDAGWEAGGFRYIFETFDDLLTNPKSNEMASEYIRKKIRAIVKDRKTADMLCPHYPLLAKRPPLGHFYYECFNKPNVSLVDISKDTIQELTPSGLRTSTTEYEFDIIIFAIGFDAVTGSLTQMDIRGQGNRSLSQEWSKRLETYLGISVKGYPNMFMISGPQAPFANIPVIIDNTADWIGKAIVHMRKHGYTRIETTQDAVDRWCNHVSSSFEATLLATASLQVRSWYIGANVPGKPHSVLFYFGGLVAYFQHCEKEAVDGFTSFKFSSPKALLAV